MNYNLERLFSKNSIVIVVEEGKGSYRGRSRNPKFNPCGRMGARVSAYKNKELVYVSNNASTLPDSVSKWYATNINDCSPIPCVCEGVYDVYGKMHLGKHKALELGLNNATVPVIRNDVLSTSNAINFHYRKANDPSVNSMYASSVGCITMLKNELYEMLNVLGVNSFNGNYVGKVVVDRSGICEDKKLYDMYKEYFKNTINNFATFNVQPKAVEPNVNNVSEWAIKGHDFVVGNNISDGTKPKDFVTREEMWTMLERVLTIIEEKAK